MKKRILFGLAGLVVIAVAYYGSVEYFFWQWESPHEPLPEGTYELTQSETLSTDHAAIADSLQAEMEALAKAEQTVSISGAVAIGGSPAWAGTVGFAQIEKGVPANTSSQYRIGSVSKSLTATALMQLVEKGQIDLDADVRTYLPDYPGYDTPMTTRQLASHMAGVRHYNVDLTLFPPTDAYGDEHFATTLDATRLFRDDALLFNPGEGFSYSTHGYTLLSAVMAAAAEKPFLEIMSEQIFDPLGMEYSSAKDRTKGLPGLVNFYYAGGGLFGPSYPVDLSNKWAGGGLVSTPTDLVKFGAAVLNGQLLDPAARQTMVSRQRMADGSDNPQAYALGWRHHKTIHILGEDSPVDVIHHGGTSVGGAAFLLLVPEYDIVVAYLTNGRTETIRGELQMLAYRSVKMILDASQQ